jgi:DNA gyrase subunit A
MASNICSFNLREVCETAVAYLRDKECDLSKTLSAPDFSTGGELIYRKNEMDEIYKTGRGSFKVRAKYGYDKKNNCLEITEIPYTTTVEAIMDKIVELVKQGKIRDISDLRDETDLNGLKLAIDLKRGADPEKLMARLFKSTPLEDAFSCNFNILVHGAPCVLGVRGMLREWADFRIGCVRRRLNFELDKKSRRLHLLRGLEKILLDIDKAVRVIRQTEREEDVVPNLCAAFQIDALQAEFIAEIRLRQLNREYILKRLEDIAGLEKEIAALRNALASDREIKNIIVGELKEIAKKYGAPRKTALVSGEEIQEIHEEHFIEDYNLKLFLTRQNYFKKIPLISLRSGGEQKIKEDDEILCAFECANRDEALFFSNKAAVYKARVHELADCKASALGEYLPNVLEMDADEKIIFVMASDAKFEGNLLFVFENGKMAKVPLKAYETKTNRKKLANAYYGGVPLAAIQFLSEDREFAAVTNIDKVLVFDTGKIPLKTTRNTQGVQVMTMKKGSKLTKLLPLDAAAFASADYYRTKNLPARGAYLKGEDIGFTQTSLF